MTLALGIGANTAVYSLINAALLKMLPVRDPQQLLQFSRIDPVFGPNDYFSYPEFQLFQHETQAFSGLFAFANLNGVNVEVNGTARLPMGRWFPATTLPPSEWAPYWGAPSFRRTIQCPARVA